MRLDLRKLRFRQPKLVATHLCLLFGSRESRHYVRANTFMGPDPKLAYDLGREIFDGLGPRGHRGGVQSKSEDQPHGKQLAHAPQPEMRSAGEEREALPVPTDEERPLPYARGEVTGTAEGE